MEVGGNWQGMGTVKCELENVCYFLCNFAGIFRVLYLGRA